MKEDKLGKAIALIIEAAELLDWQIVFPNDEDEVSYIMVINPEKADEVIDKLEK